VKVLPFKIPKPSNTAIVFQIDEGSFYEQLHQHEELQISHIICGRGTIIVGDTAHHYEEGDIIIIGGQLPHVFRNEQKTPLMQTIFFSPLSFGSDFLQLEEGSGVGSFYAFAKAGLKTRTTSEINQLFTNISTSQGIRRLSYFLQLLDILKQQSHIQLSTFIYERKISESDGKKLSDIFAYTLENFREEIRLENVADIAFMSPNAFCKYFKKRTKKTFFQFVIELRIQYACSLLRQERDLSIAAIAMDSGFQTLSHFNRKFRLLKGETPRDFRKKNSSFTCRDAH